MGELSGIPNSRRLDKSFYLDSDVTGMARRLLGKYLVTRINGLVSSGMIVETEAYRGPDDKACHAYQNKKTPRTKPMFEAGGIAYVYLCYGIHHLFNVVSGPEGMAHAVLIRAIAPADNVELMLQRRKHKRVSPKLSAGPGVLSSALGITTALNGQSLTSPDSPIWLEDRGHFLPEADIISTTRIGVAYAGDCAFREWRFFIKDNPWISKPA